MPTGAKPKPRHQVIQPSDPSVKIIPLNTGAEVLVDAEDYAMLMQWAWTDHMNRVASRTTHVNKKPRLMLMHRQIMNAKPGESVDHINRNTRDNRKSNLRICSHRENCYNTSRPNSKKASKYKGVHKLKNSLRWRATIGFNGGTQVRKDFDTEIEAATQYNEWAKHYHGEFASLNVIDGPTQKEEVRT